jgi:DNA polymerase I-like protein with 3'-5' exonuclease and polymerase domains
MAVLDLKRAKRFEHTAVYPNLPAWNFIVRPSYDTVAEIIALRMADADAGELWLDIDIETRANHIACFGFSWSRTDALCIPFMCVENREGYWSEEEEVGIVAALRRLLTHPNVKCRWQNGLFDAQYIYRHWHFLPNHGQDTMISHHVMYAGLRKALDFQSSMYCDHYVFWKDDGKTWSKDVGEDQLWAYNCTDCVRTREVGEVELAAIPRMGLEYPHQFQQRLFPAVLAMMNRGVRVDLARRQKFAIELQEEIAEREEFFQTILGHPLNPASSPQMLKLFYQDLGQRPIMSRPTKLSPAHPTLNDEALEILKNREPILRPLIKAIQEYRTLGVFLSTFVMAKLDSDGQLRCSFNICGTETYRFASSKNAFGSGTNFQNIPSGGESDDGLVLPNIREIFIPDPSHTFYDIDLSKADLRVVVWESDCREMKAMLREGKDPYIEIAREFYHDPSITKKLPSGGENPKYRTFKSLAHGTHYLGTPQGLARRLGLTVHEVDRVQKWYFERNPEIKQWQKQFVETLFRTRKVRNIFGFERYYFDRVDDTTAREAIAWLPQSTVAVYINHVIVTLHETSRLVQPLLQVHDSAPGQFPSYKRDEALADIRRAADIPLPYDDPLTIPFEIKTSEVSWGACK